MISRFQALEDTHANGVPSASAWQELQLPEAVWT
jgi:hypothetical protein